MLIDELKKVTNRFARQVEKAILANEFTILDRPGSRIIVKVLGEEVNLWVSDEENLYIWALKVNGSNYYVPNICTFKNIPACMELLNNVSIEEKKRIKEEISELENKLKKLKGELK